MTKELTSFISMYICMIQSWYCHNKTLQQKECKVKDQDFKEDTKRVFNLQALT